MSASPPSAAIVRAALGRLRMASGKAPNVLRAALIQPMGLEFPLKSYVVKYDGILQNVALMG